MRTPYDIMMNEKFNPLLQEEKEHYHGNNGYHAPPWPAPRTMYDENLQNKWCPNCDKLPHMNFPRNK